MKILNLRKLSILFVALAFAALLAACGDNTATIPAATVAGAAPQGQTITTASGLKYVDTVVGSGAQPQKGQTVTVHYSGYLVDGKKFDSSLDAGQPFSFVLGASRVIKGWDEGLATMKVGGKRRLTIPPELGYGPSGSPPVIPPNAVLVFDVELLSVK